MISHKYRFVCPRIGKNASSTLVRFFSQLDSSLIDEGHESVLGDGFKPFLEKFFNNNSHNKYFKFAFARNPYDRLVSAWFEYCKKDQFSDIKNKVKNDKDHSVEDTLQNFKDFVRMSLKYPHIHWKSQYEMIHHDDDLLVHYIGKVENIKLDLMNVCNILGIKNHDVDIPTVRSTPNRTHYSKYYDEELQSLVKETYAKDLSFFEYEFEWRN